MGMGFPFGSARRSCRQELTPGDPNPARFEIQSLEGFGPYVVAVIDWPDAKNFEGRKIAVYRATIAEIQNAKRLDPHFQEQRGPLVPVARFAPDLLGIAAARACAQWLAGQWP